MSAATFNKEALKRLKFWIMEREAVRKAKEAGKPAPWTKDPIIGKFRFCNVRRNDDRVTRWIHNAWLHPHAGQPDLWFAMVVARLVNWPDTLEGLGKALFSGKGDVRWRPDAFVSHMHWRKAEGHKTFGGAYIVSTNGHKMDKAEYLAERVLNPMWAARVGLRPAPKGHSTCTLEWTHKHLTAYDGMGSFMAAQVVADIKYDKLGDLWQCSDWHSWAAPGPGSLRGMERLVYGDILGSPQGMNRQWEALFEELYPMMVRLLPSGTLDSAQDLQNCLCEFDKYERVRLGQGTPRALYKPHGE